MEELLFDRFAVRAGLPAGAPVASVVSAVQAIPYGRPAERTVHGVLADWKGTCSTKHALLAALLAERWPELRPALVHRVYRVDRAMAQRQYGELAASKVPAEGLTDVHRYLVITLDGAEVTIDITFPGDPPWDEHGPMPLACGPGWDVRAGADPYRAKAELERQFCDPRVREPFIAALSRAAAP